jgi:quercetin dioxygenase-like cupin family protein
MAVVRRCDPSFDPSGPRSEVVYEDANAKVVRFYLKGGQEIKPHRSGSSVFITVLKGKLRFTLGDEGEETLEEGSTVFYRPRELHGFVALEDSVVEAVIAPNPSAGASQRM